MKRLEQKKLLTIIAGGELEKKLIVAMTKRGIGGYTVVPARGAGATGIQSGTLEGDSNILIYVVLSEPRLVAVLDDIEALMKRGYRDRKSVV